MCQAKIVDYYNFKYKCLRPDTTTITTITTYGFGHLAGKTRTVVRTLCSKHAKILRYNVGVKRKRGHPVTLTEQIILKTP